MYSAAAQTVLLDHQFGHINPGTAVGEDDREQDEAVGGSYQHDTQVHSVSMSNLFINI